MQTAHCLLHIPNPGARSEPVPDEYSYSQVEPVMEATLMSSWGGVSGVIGANVFAGFTGVEILVAVMRSFSKNNPAQVLYTQEYIDQIIPFLQTLYSQSTQWVLQQGGVPLPASNTIYLPPACSDLQQLLNELSGAQSFPLGTMTHLNSKIMQNSQCNPQRPPKLIG